MTGARLVPVRRGRDPRGIVLVLHGGASRGDRAMVSPAQLSVLRMVPLAQRIALAGRSRLAVHRLLNTHRAHRDTHQRPTSGRGRSPSVEGHRHRTD